MASIFDKLFPKDETPRPSSKLIERGLEAIRMVRDEQSVKMGNVRRVPSHYELRISTTQYERIQTIDARRDLEYYAKDVLMKELADEGGRTFGDHAIQVRIANDPLLNDNELYASVIGPESSSGPSAKNAVASSGKTSSGSSSRSAHSPAPARPQPDSTRLFEEGENPLSERVSSHPPVSSAPASSAEETSGNRSDAPFPENDAVDQSLQRDDASEAFPEYRPPVSDTSTGDDLEESADDRTMVLDQEFEDGGGDGEYLEPVTAAPSIEYRLIVRFPDGTIRSFELDPGRYVVGRRGSSGQSIPPNTQKIDVQFPPTVSREQFYLEFDERSVLVTRAGKAEILFGDSSELEPGRSRRITFAEPFYIEQIQMFVEERHVNT